MQEYDASDMVPTGMSPLERGTQIIYVPPHVREQLPDKLTPGVLRKAYEQYHDVEAGFVTSYKVQSDGTQVAYCRYWSKQVGGALRTVSCSEATPVECLHVIATRPYSVIEVALEFVGEMERRDAIKTNNAP